MQKSRLMFLLHFLKSDVHSQPWCREPDQIHTVCMAPVGASSCQFSMSRSCVYILRKAEPLFLKFSTGMDHSYYFPMSSLKFTYFYWSIVDLQCCVSFRCMAKWSSLYIIYTYSAYIYIYHICFPGGTVVKNLPAKAGDAKDAGRSPGWEDPLEEEMTTHSIILAWRIPWTKEPNRLQSTGSQRIRHVWVTEHAHACILHIFFSFSGYFLL